MASVYDLKPKFQAILRPIAQALFKTGVTPNQVTIAALFGSFVVGALAVQTVANRSWLLLFPFWLFLRMALNAIDGMLAREHNLKSFSGAILNEVGDILSDAALFLPLALVRADAACAIVLFTLGAVLSEFCGVLGQALGTKRHYEGPMGKSDRALLVGTLALVSFLYPSMMNIWTGIFWAGFGLTIMTCYNRIDHILKELKHG